jgi:uncharacterized protein
MSHNNLVSSIINNDLERVISIVETDIDLNQPNEDLPLAYAVAYDRVEIVKILLEKGAFSADWIMLQLPRKASEGTVEILSLLAEYGIDLDFKMEDDDTFLMWVAREGEIDIVKHLIKLGADPNRLNRDGESPLMYAGFYAKQTGDWNVYKYLEPLTGIQIRTETEECLKNQIDISKIDPLVDELITAAIYGDLEKIHILVGQGVDINATGESGNTALHIAANWGKVPVVQALIDYGVNVNLIDLDDSGTPLMNAISMLSVSKSSFTTLPIEMESNLLETISILIGSGADVNIKTKEGWNALASAANSGSLETVNLLLEYGADVNAKDSWGDTALSRAKQNYTKGVSLGSAALNQAMKIEYSKIIQVLLAAGAIENDLKVD